MEEISIFNNEVEPIEIRLGSIPEIDYTKPTVGKASGDDKDYI